MAKKLKMSEHMANNIRKRGIVSAIGSKRENQRKRVYGIEKESRETSIENQLANETQKWKKRIKIKMKTVKFADEQGKEFLDNIKAYINDSDYFLGKKDLVRAFEAIIWAWSLYETGKRAGLLV